MYIIFFIKKIIKKFRDHKFNEGFTFLEFILVITLLGITSSIVIPVFKNATNKSKQKEAALIVSSMIKGAKSDYALKANLPSNMGALSKYSNFQKCEANNVEIKGQLVCKNTSPVNVEKTDVSFFSPSGNYKIDLLKADINNEGQMFMVKANPNGEQFINKGSAVIGCYSPLSGITLIKEYSSKKFDKGEKPFITCGTKDIEIALKIKGCMDPEALNYNPDATIPDPEKPCIFSDDDKPKEPLSKEKNEEDIDNKIETPGNSFNQKGKVNDLSGNLVENIKSKTKKIKIKKDNLMYNLNAEKSSKTNIEIEEIESPIPPWLK